MQKTRILITLIASLITTIAVAKPAPRLPIPLPPLRPVVQSSTVPPLATALQSIIAGGTAKIIADLQSMDSVASIVDPNSTAPPPNNLWNPYAHACAAPAIAWLQSIPSISSVPTPSGSGGILTTIVVAGADLQATQDFISKITVTGIPASLHMACDPFVMWIVRQPASIQANLTVDIANFMALFQKS